MSKISTMKESKGRVNMFNLSRSVPEECDKNLLSEPSSNTAGGRQGTY